MTATGHALIGTLIAAKFQAPELVLPLALASHFVADFVPHWDAGTHKRKKTRDQLLFEASIDASIGFVAAYILYTQFFGQSNILLWFLAVIAAQLPDYLFVMSEILRKKYAFLEYMNKIQSRVNQKLDKPWGIITQGIAIYALYIFLFKVI